MSKEIANLVDKALLWGQTGNGEFWEAYYRYERDNKALLVKPRPQEDYTKGVRNAEAFAKLREAVGRAPSTDPRIKAYELILTIKWALEEATPTVKSSSNSNGSSELWISPLAPSRKRRLLLV